ncbi:MAG: protein-glutamine gamma-glutamyltransferase [Bacilli bacterium]
MIIVNGTRVRPTLQKDGTLNYEQKAKILDSMDNSNYALTYQNVDALQFDVALRYHFIESARKLNGSRISFRNFQNSFCNPIFWHRDWNGGFRIQPNVTPANAITDIFVNGQYYGTECATAIIMMMYEALLQLMNPVKFNMLFANMQLYTWNHDSDLKIVTTFQSAYCPGDVVYFKNPQVHPATPEWQGENTVYLDDGMYYGHGTSIAPAEQIVWKLNLHRMPYATISAYISDQITHMNADAMANYAERSKIQTSITLETMSRSDYMLVTVGECTQYIDLGVHQ